MDVFTQAAYEAPKAGLRAFAIRNPKFVIDR